MSSVKKSKVGKPVDPSSKRVRKSGGQKRKGQRTSKPKSQRVRDELAKATKKVIKKKLVEAIEQKDGDAEKVVRLGFQAIRKAKKQILKEKICVECGQSNKVVAFKGRSKKCNRCRERERLELKKEAIKRKDAKDSRKKRILHRQKQKELKEIRNRAVRLAKLEQDPNERRRKLTEAIKAKKEANKRDKERVKDITKEELIQDLHRLQEEINNL